MPLAVAFFKEASRVVFSRAWRSSGVELCVPREDSIRVYSASIGGMTKEAWVLGTVIDKHVFSGDTPHENGMRWDAAVTVTRASHSADGRVVFLWKASQMAIE